LHAIGSPIPYGLLEFRNVLSANVEQLLVRDRILKADIAAPERPLRDMEDWTKCTLRGAERMLRQIESSQRGTPQRVNAEARLLLKIRELQEYTHISDGLAEVSSALLALQR
jgi:hypothetical protein